MHATDTTCSIEFFFLSEVAKMVAQGPHPDPLTSKAVVQVIATVRSITSPSLFLEASKQAGFARRHRTVHC